MTVVGAGADRFDLRVRKVGADGGGEDLLHQSATTAAGGGGLGVRLDLIEGEEPLGLNGPDDVALGDAVTAAHLGVVRHGHDGVGAAVTGVGPGPG